MKKLNKTLLIICLGLGMIYGLKADANNILGGEITWNQVGKDSFMITLTLYRDCNGNAFGNQQVLVKCQSTGTTLDTLIFSAVTGVDITPVCSTQCNKCDSSGCTFSYGVQKFVYQKLLLTNKAGSCCKILLTYSQCCRSSKITTGPANSNFYIYSWFSKCLTQPTNAPVSKGDLAHFLKIGEDFSSFPMNSDIDRDSNNYLIDSFRINLTCPKISYGYNDEVSYSYPYNCQCTKICFGGPCGPCDQFIYYWGFPQHLPFPRTFHFNNSTGEMFFRPMKIEQTVGSIRIEEWRKVNGVPTQIGEIICEMGFIVSYQTNNSPLISGIGYKEICAGDKVTISYNTNEYDSKDTLTLDYYGEINDAYWTDNNGQVKHPTGTFTWQTKEEDANPAPYVFTVTVKDDACPMNAKVTKICQIIVKKKPETPEFRDTTNYCSELRLFIKKPVNYYTYNWEINNNPIIKMKGSDIYFPAPKAGKIPIRLYAEYNGCKSNMVVDTINVDTFLILEKMDTAICENDSIKITAKYKYNKGNVHFLWSTGDRSQDVVIKPDKTGMYYLTVEDTFGCIFTDSFKLIVNPPPDLMPLSDLSICSGDSVWLSALSAGNDSFDLDDIPCFYKLPDPNPLQCGYFHMQRKDSGDYVIRVTSKYGCVVLDTFKLSLYPEVKAFAADTTLCPNETIILKADSTGSKSDSTIYLWYDYITGDLIGSGQSITAKADINKVFRLYAAEWFNDKYCINSHLVSLKRKTTMIDPHFPESFCINDSFIDLTKFINNREGTLFTLHPSVKDSFYFNPALSGMLKDSLQMIFTDYSSSCTFDSLLVFNKLEIPSIYISNHYLKNSFCPEYGKIKLYASPFSAKYSNWYGPVDDSSFFDARTSPGIYTLVYEYKANNGCLNRDTMILSIGETAIAIDKSDTAVCSGKHFSAMANVAFAQKMQWIYGSGSDGFMNGSIYNAQNTYIPGAGDKLNKGFTLYAKTIDPVCPETWDSIHVYIAAQPKADFSADMLTGNPPLNVQFSDQTNIAYDYISDYLWDFGGGNKSTLKDPMHTYTDTGSYTVSLKVNTVYGCEDSIGKKKLIYVYPVSLDENNLSKISVYPNPAQDQLIIESTSKLEKVILYNFLGAKIRETEANNESKINLERRKLPSGLYLLKVYDKKGDVYVYQVVFK